MLALQFCSWEMEFLVGVEGLRQGEEKLPLGDGHLGQGRQGQVYQPGFGEASRKGSGRGGSSDSPHNIGNQVC